METTKKVSEVFSDYKQESNITNATIQQMNLIKKVNVLEMKISSDEYLELKDLWFFEQFLRERFQFANVDIIIQYSEDVKINSIEKEWKNLIAYMVHKYPLMKPMILLKSTIEIEQNNITVNMKIKGADFLRGRKLDRELERVIKNIFNKEYKIKFVEVLNKEDEIALEDPNPTELNGSVFMGWAYDDDPEHILTDTFAFDADTTQDGTVKKVTLTGVWELYEGFVNFYDENDELIEAKEFTYGGSVTEPTHPEKEGHTWAGWKLGDGTSFNAQKVEAGDWALISLKPFTSEEKLTVTMKDGKQFTVKLTDGQLHSYVISDSGDTYEVIVTYDDTAEIPKDAELKVREIKATEKEFAENIEATNRQLQSQEEQEITNVVQFDITIVSDGVEVEPKEGSLVNVEIRLVERKINNYTN